MGGKSHHKTRAHADRKPDKLKPVQPPRREREAQLQRTRNQLEALLQDAKIERQTQGETLEAFKRKYQGNVPVDKIWTMLADRRIGVSTTTRGAECARS